MNQFLAICFLMFAPAAFGSGILIQSASVSRIEFEEFLRQHPENQSYVQFMLRKQSPQEISASNLQWAQQLLDRKEVPASFAQELEVFESEGMMDKSRRAFLKDFLQKLIDKNPGDKALRKLACKWEAFPGDTNFESLCARPTQSLSSFALRFPYISSILLEDYSVSLHSGAALNLDPNEVFNWRLLSNSRKMVSFRGSFQDLIQHEFHPENLIQGSCDSFSHGMDDMELVSNGFAFFNENCIKTLRQPETLSTAQWVRENRSWIIPAGIAVLGAMAYQFKDKRIVIQKPSFR